MKNVKYKNQYNSQMQCDEMSKACVHEVSEKEKNENKGKEHSESH